MAVRLCEKFWDTGSKIYFFLPICKIRFSLSWDLGWVSNKFWFALFANAVFPNKVTIWMMISCLARALKCNILCCLNALWKKGQIYSSRHLGVEKGYLVLRLSIIKERRVIDYFILPLKIKYSDGTEYFMFWYARLLVWPLKKARCDVLLSVRWVFKPKSLSFFL